MHPGPIAESEAEATRVWDPEQLELDAHPEPPRTRRSSDLLRLIATLSLLAVLLLLGSVGSGTTEGIQEDITTAFTTVPAFVVGVMATLSTVAVLALPAYLIIDLAVRRRWRLLLVSLVAGLLGVTVAEVFDHYSDELIDGALLDALTLPLAGGAGRTPAAFGLFAAVAALLIAQGQAVRPRSIAIVWATLGGMGALFVIDSRATPLALLISVLGGVSIGLLIRYLTGTENPRVSGEEIAAALARVGVPPARLAQREVESEHGRRFELQTTDGRVGMVQVYDPDRRTAKIVSSLTRVLRVRTWVTRYPGLTERSWVQQAAVPVLLARSQGVKTPGLLAVVEVDEDTLALVEEREQSIRLLCDVSPEAISDEALAQVWREVRRMHHVGIAHEDLHPGSFAVDEDGAIWLLGLTQGEIAAPRLRMRLDRAELLIATAMLVGTDRAITAAERAIGAEDLANLPALMQPVALNPAIRSALKDHPELLQTLRDEAIARAPEPSAAAVKLERLRPRSVVSLIAATFAVYVLAGQLGDVNFDTVFSNVAWEWVAIAVGASMVTYFGSAWTISPFSPVEVSQGRWLMGQFAATFITLVAPAAVGSAGTNVRVIQQAGASPALAIASVGVSTTVSFVTTVLALVVVTVLSADDPNWSIEAPSNGILLIVGVIAALMVLAFIVPASRRVILARIQPMWENAAPRLLDVLRNPRRLFAGVGGSLLTSLAYAATLYAAVRAYGVEIPIAAAVVVYLGAGILGSVAPTPGGIGAVEAALVAGLSAVGVPPDAALPAALLYRTVTFWLPTVPGWFAFQWLQRRDAI